jgi:5'-methylthioadenosine/S-adenosylhomocysteine nucleosidase
MAVLILGAMDGEISDFIEAMDQRNEDISSAGVQMYSGRLSNRDVVVAKSGVGKVMAALTTQNILDHIRSSGRVVEYLVFTGLAGAINPAYRIGDTLIAVDCVQHDLDATALRIPRGTIPYSKMRFIGSDLRLVEAAQSYRPVEGTVHTGRVLTGDQFIHQRNNPEYAYMTVELEGDAVEMEGAAAATCALVNGVPFVLIRTISDQADGKARVKFSEFLPKASRNSLQAVLHLLDAV